MPKKELSAPTTAPDYGFERDAEPFGLRVRIAAAVGNMAATGSFSSGLASLGDPNGVESALLGIIKVAGFIPNDPHGINDPATFSRKVQFRSVGLLTDETSNPDTAFNMVPVGGVRNFHDNTGNTHLSSAVGRVVGGEFKDKIRGARGRLVSRAAGYLVDRRVVEEIESSRSARLSAAKRRANGSRQG